MEWWVSSSNSSVVCKLVCDIETTKKQVEVRKGNNRDKRREEREEKRENQRSDKSKKRGQRRKKTWTKESPRPGGKYLFLIDDIDAHTHTLSWLSCSVGAVEPVRMEMSLPMTHRNRRKLVLSRLSCISGGIHSGAARKTRRWLQRTADVSCLKLGHLWVCGPKLLVSRWRFWQCGFGCRRFPTICAHRSCEISYFIWKSKVKKDLVLEMGFREVAEILIFQTGNQ